MSLVGHWPLNETGGDVLHDIVNGQDMTHKPYRGYGIAPRSTLQFAEGGLAQTNTRRRSS